MQSDVPEFAAKARTDAYQAMIVKMRLYAWIDGYQAAAKAARAAVHEGDYDLVALDEEHPHQLAERALLDAEAKHERLAVEALALLGPTVKMAP